MEFGDLINILLILVFAIIAPIVSAVSKKRKNANAPVNNSQGAQGFDSVIESFANELELLKEEKAEAFEEERVHAQHSKAKPYLNVDLETAQEAELDIMPSENSANTVKKALRNKMKTAKSGCEIAKDFDIKKAVIYSEILNSKYF